MKEPKLMTLIVDRYMDRLAIKQATKGVKMTFKPRSKAKRSKLSTKKKKRK